MAIFDQMHVKRDACSGQRSLQYRANGIREGFKGACVLAGTLRDLVFSHRPHGVRKGIQCILTSPFNIH